MTTAVAPVNELRTLLEKSKSQIALALPRHLTAERMIRVATTTYLKNPKLQECSSLSIVSCVVQSSELGLELSGPLGQAYMVPYYNKQTQRKEAQFQIGYRGLIELAYRSGKVETFTSRIVYANDHFKVHYGTDQKIDHIPTMGDGGEIVAVYAVVKMMGGASDFEVMSRKQIEDHRQRYSKQTDGSFNPWNTAWEEMARKTPMRRLAKRVPLSIDLVSAAAIDEHNEAEISQHQLITVSEPPTGKFDLKNGSGVPNGTTNGSGTTLAEGELPPETKTEPPPGEQNVTAATCKSVRDAAADACSRGKLSLNDFPAKVYEFTGRRQLEDSSEKSAQALLGWLVGLGKE